MMHAAALAALACGFLQPADFAAPDAIFVAVVLDDSGSMDEPMPGARGSKMDAAKAALRGAFAALPPATRVGLFTLNTGWVRDGDESGFTAFPIGETDPAEIAAVLDQVRAEGGTPLGARVVEAADALLAARAANRYGSYRLLIVTDGEANDADLLEAAVPRALGAGLTADVIGVAMAADHTLATKVDRYRSADDPAALSAALAETLAESGGAGDDGAARDYELIASLPDGFAAAALPALADDADAPLRINPPEDDEFVRRPPPPPGRFPRPNAGARDEEFGGGFGGACCCLFPFALAVVGGIVAVRAISAGGRRRKRRRPFKKF